MNYLTFGCMLVLLAFALHENQELKQVPILQQEVDELRSDNIEHYQTEVQFGRLYVADRMRNR